MGRAAARELGVAPEEVLVASTGVIGVPLPIDRIEEGLVGLAAELQDDPVLGARGIMTTDTHPKALSLQVPGSAATLSVVAKGAGMIAPNMATMLAFLFTDAALPRPALDGALRRVVDRTFNRLSVDGDTSTSDMCVLLASGESEVDPARFEEALLALCTRTVEVLARDGEGASRRRGGRGPGGPLAGQLAADEDHGLRGRPQCRSDFDGGGALHGGERRSRHHRGVDLRYGSRAIRRSCRVRRGAGTVVAPM
jgi:hypothetical protein